MRTAREIFGGKPCKGCGDPAASPAQLADALPRSPAIVSSSPVRGVMSLWTWPANWRAEYGPLLIQTLAVCLAGERFRETQLVTDCKGAALAVQLGWEFGEISTALEAFRPAGCQHIWALGKMAALAMQSGPCVHLDGDVLLLHDLPESLLSARLLAQSPDFPEHYSTEVMRRAEALCRLPRATPYNAGLIGGSDAALVRAYAYTSLDLAAVLARSDIDGSTASMCMEQSGLGAFAQRAGVPVTTLLPSIRPSALDLHTTGFRHLTGKNKRAARWIAMAEARLSREYPAAYECFRAARHPRQLLRPPENFDAPYCAPF